MCNRSFSITHTGQQIAMLRKGPAKHILAAVFNPKNKTFRLYFYFTELCLPNLEQQSHVLQNEDRTHHRRSINTLFKSLIGTFIHQYLGDKDCFFCNSCSYLSEVSEQNKFSRCSSPFESRASGVHANFKQTRWQMVRHNKKQGIH